jgi:threonyl-tRNA synthetase
MHSHPTARKIDDNDALLRVRHSLAHVLAEAVQQLRPGTKLGFGPPIDDGFYYDFILSEPLNETDFPELERRMREILARAQAFEREELPSDAALTRLAAMGEPYKREYAAELVSQPGGETVSFYRSGSFVDMCEGPHVRTTAEIPGDAFKLRRIAGAYWRGASNNTMMTRVYAWAFLSSEELRTALIAHEDALARDHKKLGRELEIFTFHDAIGKGLPLWLPNGTAIRDELEKLMKELEFEAQFERVATPHLARRQLYERTGHLPYYAAHMFPLMKALRPAAGERDGTAATSHVAPESDNAEDYCLRPMNCPHHHMIFASRRRSYRELPLRLAEYGQTYRYEDSGAVSGLLRVRGMCMNDGHIYCSKEQVVAECLGVLEMHRRVYSVLGLRNWSVRFSRRDHEPGGSRKYVEDEAGWQEAEGLLQEVLNSSGLPFTDGPGEAAFYGPKIDFQFRTVTGREETASTLQLDFAMPKRLDLRYTGADGAEHRPFVIHRAPLGTHERFVALLLEHYAGAFPTWLAPVQVRVLPVNEACAEYARAIVRQLRARSIRADADTSGEGVSKKVRAATIRKIPNVLVVGPREQADGSVTVRRYAVEQQQRLTFDAFLADVLDVISKRSSR